MTSTSPRPWKYGARFRSVAVDKKTRFTSSGCFRYSRRIDRNAAITPETCGAAWLVPESSRYSAISLRPLRRTLPAPLGCDIWDDLHDRIFSPGASRSGFMRPSPVGPFDEKYETP